MQSSPSSRPSAGAQPIHEAPRLQRWIVCTALTFLLVGLGTLSQSYGIRHGGLFLVGAAFGIVLYHAGFGFTSAFRAFIVHRDGKGLRAQMLMLALATVLFAPLLALNPTVGGAVAPLSLSVLAGAWMFGIGMQLGGG